MWISEEERKQHAQQDAAWRQRRRDLKNAEKPKNKRRKRRRRRRQQEEFEAISKRALGYLKEFWEKFNAAEGDQARLALLKQAANPPWQRVSGKMRSLCRRDKYHRMSILFSSIQIERCATCENPPADKHHIIPCCFGGPTIVLNLIMICEQCHAVIHPWLFSQEVK